MLQKTKKIFIVTHGETDHTTETNPSMSQEGCDMVLSSRQHLPTTPSVVVVGTGNRHLDVAFYIGAIGNMLIEEFAFTPNFPCVVTPLVGGPETIVTVDGRKFVIMADDTEIPMDNYIGHLHLKSSLEELIRTLPDNAVICGEPWLLPLLGHADAKLATVYRLDLNADKLSADLRIYGIKEIMVAARVE